MTRRAPFGKEVKKPMTDRTINRLPVKTWNWLGMNETTLERRDAELLEAIQREDQIELFAGPGETAERMLDVACGDQQSKKQTAELTAKEGSSLTVWMTFSSAKEAEGCLAFAARIKAEAHAKVRLVQVQLLGAGCRLFNDIQAVCETGARVELLQLFLGGGKTWAALRSSLNGPESSVSVQLGYWLRDVQRLDMNYVTLHQEKKTKSELLAKGVLDDRAFKLFRGTIDFKKGSSGSEGEETEEVLMLGEGAVNRTIPLILCGEEDVRGNHGATIGEADEDVLFYLASRGVGKAAAINLLARMQLEKLRARIGNEALEEAVQKYMEEMTEHDGTQCGRTGPKRTDSN